VLIPAAIWLYGSGLLALPGLAARLIGRLSCAFRVYRRAGCSVGNLRLLVLVLDCLSEFGCLPNRTGSPPNSALMTLVGKDVVQMLLQYLRLSAYFEAAPRQGLTQGIVRATAFGRPLAHIAGKRGGTSEWTHATPLLSQNDYTDQIADMTWQPRKLIDLVDRAL